MFIVQNYFTAVLFCVVTMLCWGSWGNTQKLAARTWRPELFYWDYVIGILLTALVFAFTLGSYGEDGRNFMSDLSQADGASLLAAFLGGVIFNLANILLIVAISIAGLSVAFPVGIGIALIWGVVNNYIRIPSGNFALIFMGVLLISVGVVVNAIAYRRLRRNEGNVPVKGLVISVVAGVLMAQFYGFVVDAMAQNFSHPEAGKLTPYTALVIFSVGIFLSNIVFNTVLMRRPVEGEPVSYRDYFRGDAPTHLTGILGGLIWCVGMTFSIIAAEKAGPAISYGLGQGAVLVAALWGVFVWKEFDSGPRGTNILLAIMFFCFLTGLGLIVYSKLAGA